MKPYIDKFNDEVFLLLKMFYYIYIYHVITQESFTIYLLYLLKAKNMNKTITNPYKLFKRYIIVLLLYFKKSINTYTKA